MNKYTSNYMIIHVDTLFRKGRIKKHSNENDVVLDCFSGSATTAVACIKTNRNFIGCELNKIYYDKSLERLKGLDIDFDLIT